MHELTSGEVAMVSGGDQDACFSNIFNGALGGFGVGATFGAFGGVPGAAIGGLLGSLIGGAAAIAVSDSCSAR